MRSTSRAAIVLLLVAGCATGNPGATLLPGSTTGPSATPEPSASPAGPATSGPSDAGTLQLVVIGDSIVTGGETSGGAALGVPLAVAIEALTGRSVEPVMRADPALTTTLLLQRVRSSETWRASIAGADIITITVGGNDGDPFGSYPAGICAPDGAAETCLAAYAPDLEENLAAILAEVQQLRAGRPTAIRVTSPDYNAFIGLQPNPDLPPFAADFGLTFYRQVAEAETAVACAVAERHGALCVDFYHAFNGPDGTADAAALLAADHLHPSTAGLQRIVGLLIAAGLAPLSSGAS